MLFLSGQRVVSWTLEVLRDNVKERNEKLRVTLRTTENAILGRKDKANINIINYNNG